MNVISAESLVTGYFGNSRKGGKVHVFKKNGDPLCGVKFSSDMHFHFCCCGVEYEWVECKSCRKLIQNGYKDG